MLCQYSSLVEALLKVYVAISLLGVLLLLYGIWKIYWCFFSTGPGGPDHRPLSPGGPHSSSSSSSSSFGVHNDIELALHHLHDGEDDIMGSSPSFSGILQWVAVGGGQPDVDNEDAASAEFVEMHSGQEASSLSMVVSSGGSITGRGPQAPLPPKML